MKQRKNKETRRTSDIILLSLLILIVFSLLLAVLIGRNKIKKTRGPLKSSVETALPNNNSSDTTVSIEELIKQSNELYTLQISSVRKKKNADDLIEKLRLRGYTAEVSEWRNAKGVVLYRVQVGQYISKSAARSVGEELLSKKLIRDYYIRKIN